MEYGMCFKWCQKQNDNSNETTFIWEREVLKLAFFWKWPIAHRKRRQNQICRERPGWQKAFLLEEAATPIPQLWVDQLVHDERNGTIQTIQNLKGGTHFKMEPLGLDCQGWFL